MATKYAKLTAAVGAYGPGDVIEVGAVLSERDAYQHARRGRLVYLDKQARPAERAVERKNTKAPTHTGVEGEKPVNLLMSELQGMDYSDLWSLYGDLREEHGIPAVESRKRDSLVSAIRAHYGI